MKTLNFTSMVASSCAFAGIRRLLSWIMAFCPPALVHAHVADFAHTHAGGIPATSSGNAAVATVMIVVAVVHLLGIALALMLATRDARRTDWRTVGESA